jgi:hypothetical protein
VRRPAVAHELRGPLAALAHVALGEEARGLAPAEQELALARAFGAAGRIGIALAWSGSRAHARVWCRCARRSTCSPARPPCAHTGLVTSGARPRRVALALVAGPPAIVAARLGDVRACC